MRERERNITAEYWGFNSALISSYLLDEIVILFAEVTLSKTPVQM